MTAEVCNQCIGAGRAIGREVGAGRGRFAELWVSPDQAGGRVLSGWFNPAGCDRMERV